MSTKRTLAFLLLMVAAQLYGQDYSYNENSGTKGIPTLTERTTLEITPKRAALDQNRETIMPIAGALLGPVVDVGVSFVKTQVEKRAREYTGTYGCATSGDKFYASRREVNLPVLTLRRTVTLDDSGQGNGRTADALVINLEPELSADGFAFRYRAKSVVMTYAKARTKGGFDFIDLQLDVVFRTLVMTVGKQDAVNLRAFSFAIPCVKPNAPYDVSSLPPTSWLPFPAPPQPQKDVVVYDNAGVYEFLINVTESNPYKIKATNKQMSVKDSGGAVSDLAAEIGKLLKQGDN